VNPSAPDLSFLVPDPSTILTAVGAVAVVLLGVQLAIKAHHIIADLLDEDARNERRGWYIDDGQRFYKNEEGEWTPS